MWYFILCNIRKNREDITLVDGSGIHYHHVSTVPAVSPSGDILAFRKHRDDLRGEEDIRHRERLTEERRDLRDGVSGLVVAELVGVEARLGMRLGVGDEGVDAGLDLGETFADRGDRIAGESVVVAGRDHRVEPALFARLALGRRAVDDALGLGPVADAGRRDARGLPGAAIERVDERDHLGWEINQGAADELFGDTPEHPSHGTCHRRDRVRVSAEADGEADGALITVGKEHGRDGIRRGKRTVRRADITRRRDARRFFLRLHTGGLLRAETDLRRRAAEIVPKTCRDKRADVGLHGRHILTSGDAILREEHGRRDGLRSFGSATGVRGSRLLGGQRERLFHGSGPRPDGADAHRGSVRGRLTGATGPHKRLESAAVAPVREGSPPLAERVRDGKAVLVEQPVGDSHREDGVVSEARLLREELVVRPVDGAA